LFKLFKLLPPSRTRAKRSPRVLLLEYQNPGFSNEPYFLPRKIEYSYKYSQPRSKVATGFYVRQKDSLHLPIQSPDLTFCLSSLKSLSHSTASHVMADTAFRKIDIDSLEEDVLVESDLYDPDPRGRDAVNAEAKQKSGEARGLVSK